MNKMLAQYYKKTAKYGNKKVYLYGDSIVSHRKLEQLRHLPVQIFDSEKELERYQHLRLLEKSGQIRDLKRQVPLTIQEKFVYRGETIRKIVYKADFCYTTRDGRKVVEDVKGYDVKKGRYVTTKDFDLKWKLLKFRYPEYIFLLN